MAWNDVFALNWRVSKQLWFTIYVFILRKLEFHPAERVGLVSGRIRRLIKKAFYIFSLGKESRKFCREFNVELHGTDDDRELMALYNARREESGLAEYDRSV